MAEVLSIDDAYKLKPADAKAAPAAPSPRTIAIADAYGANGAADTAAGAPSKQPGDSDYHRSRLFSQGVLDAPGYILSLPSVAAWDINDIAGRIAGKPHGGLIPQGDRALLIDPDRWQGWVGQAGGGREEAHDFGDRMAYAGGSGVGGVVSGGLLGEGMGALGAALPATGITSGIRGGLLAAPEMMTPQTIGQSSQALSSGLLGGLGSEGAGTAADAVSGHNPWVRGVASLLGGFGFGSLPYAMERGADAAAAGGRAFGEAREAASPQGQEQIVGRILNRVSEGGNTTPEAPGMPGQTLTLGQQTGNEGLLALEKSLSATDPQAVGGLVRARADASGRAHGLLDTMQEGVAPGDAARNVNRGIFDALDRSDATERAAWGAIDPNKEVSIPTAPFAKAFDEYVGAMAPANKGYIPAWVEKSLADLGDEAPIGHIVEMDKRLNAAWRKAPANSTDRTIISGLRTALREPLDELATNGLAPRVDLTPQFMRQMNTRPGEPTRLMTFLRSMGGIKPDAGGELKNMVDKVRGIINPNSKITLEDAARRAQEAGYIPQKYFDNLDTGETNPHVAGEEDLLEHLYDDMNDRPVYSSHDQPKIDRFKDIMKMQRAINSAGLDIDTATPEQVAKALGLPPREVPGLADAIDRLKAARAVTQEQKQIFNTPRELRRVVEPDKRGAYMNDSETLDRFVMPHGSTEDLDALFRADTSQATRDAVRQFAIAKIRERGQTGTHATSGERIISPTQMRKALDQYDYVLNDSRVFSQDQRNLVAAIHKGLDQAERIGKAGLPGGSDTALKLAGNRFIENAMLKAFHPDRFAAAGAGAGSLFGPFGSMAGSFVGSKIGGSMQARFAEAGDRVTQLLRDAIADPALAQALMQKATAANVQMAPAKLRPLLAPYIINSSVATFAASRGREQDRQSAR